MAKNYDYFGLGRLLSLILAIIPVTSWLLGALTRLKEGHIIAFIVRLVLGFNVIWVLDLIWMFLFSRVFRFGGII